MKSGHKWVSRNKEPKHSNRTTDKGRKSHEKVMGASDKEGEDEEGADEYHWLVRKQFSMNSTCGILTPIHPHPHVCRRQAELHVAARISNASARCMSTFS